MLIVKHIIAKCYMRIKNFCFTSLQFREHDLLDFVLQVHIYVILKEFDSEKLLSYLKEFRNFFYKNYYLNL